MSFRGIAYKIIDVACISPIEDIQEVVQNMKPLPLPLTENWMLGVIQLRGNIVPITDLSVFANNISKYDSNKNSTLVVAKDGWQYGIKVSQLVGIREITSTLHDAGTLPEAIEQLNEIVLGKYTIDTEEFFLLDLKKLTDNKRFMEP